MRIYETPRVILHLSFAIAPIILIVFIDCDRQRKIVILGHILRLKVHDLLAERRKTVRWILRQLRLQFFLLRLRQLPIKVKRCVDAAEDVFGSYQCCEFIFKVTLAEELHFDIIFFLIRAGDDVCRGSDVDPTQRACKLHSGGRQFKNGSPIVSCDDCFHV